MGPPSPRSTSESLPVSTSHRRTVPSCPADATRIGAGELFAVGAELDRQHVRLDRRQGLGAFQIPELDRFAVDGHRQEFAVWTQGDVTHRLGVFFAIAGGNNEPTLRQVANSR